MSAKKSNALTAAPAAPARWKCVCAYDGTDFYGWQSQTGGNTIQDFIEARLACVFKHPVRVHGSGRTDSGVHAAAQTFHFDADWPSDAAHLLRAFRCGLPAAVQVLSVVRAPKGFHARYGATGKRYRYRIHTGRANPFEMRWRWSVGRPLDVAKMRAAAAHLLGRHDFSAFCAKNGDALDAEDVVKDMRRLDIVARGARIDIVTEASGYLYKMVRSIAGALVEVGLGKLAPERLKEILEARVRTREVPSAPACGLTLERVFYGKPPHKR